MKAIGEHFDLHYSQVSRIVQRMEYTKHKTANWIADLGPEGGDEGGEVIAPGPPEDVVAIRGSCTGEYLRPLLLRGFSVIEGPTVR